MTEEDLQAHEVRVRTARLRTLDEMPVAPRT